jgi:hypothetical protein
LDVYGLKNLTAKGAKVRKGILLKLAGHAMFLEQSGTMVELKV